MAIVPSSIEARPTGCPTNADFKEKVPQFLEQALRGAPTCLTLYHMVQCSPLDSTFAAVADPTRRGILAHLGRRDASISELADTFAMTLTGMKKHVAVLEHTRLVTTKKEGRVRTCRLGPRTLAREAAWIASFQQMIDNRFDRLEALLERTTDK